MAITHLIVGEDSKISVEYMCKAISIVKANGHHESSVLRILELAQDLQQPLFLFF